jgi:hypothetical protein
MPQISKVGLQTMVSHDKTYNKEIGSKSRTIYEELKASPVVQGWYQVPRRCTTPKSRDVDAPSSFYLEKHN